MQRSQRPIPTYVTEHAQAEIKLVILEQRHEKRNWAQRKRLHSSVREKTTKIVSLTKDTPQPIWRVAIFNQSPKLMSILQIEGLPVPLVGHIWTWSRDSQEDWWVWSCQIFIQYPEAAQSIVVEGGGEHASITFDTNDQA